MELKRLARVPYQSVIRWIEVGHPRAGILPSIDLAETGKRHSYRVRLEDWLAFAAKLTTEPRTRRPATPPARPTQTPGSTGTFRY
jgi:hypothetical protein